MPFSLHRQPQHVHYQCASSTSTLLLGETSVALDTLLLLKHTAANDAKGEEQDCHGNCCWRVVVLYGASTVSAVIASQSSVFLWVLVSAFGTPAVHNARWICCLQLS